MEDDLVMNKLPLPKYFDGIQWNTVFKPTRKCIPKYLHDDLPALKHLYIKEKFKEIGKFNCPKLQYFDKMIKNKKPMVKAPNKKKVNHNNKSEVSYEQLKQQLQYALIIADKQSNIVDNLLQKAKSCHKSNVIEQDKKKMKRRSSLARESGNYFGDTVDLVFRQRKKQFIEGQRAVSPLDLRSAERKLNSIKLLSFQ